MNFENPLIVQSDKTLLLDVHAPLAEECRNDLIPFAELEKSPEHLHTYRLTPLSLWNASSAGFGPEDAVAVLEKYARYDVPQSVVMWIKEIASRFGKIRLIPGPVNLVPVKEDSDKLIEEKYLYLVAQSLPIYKELGALKEVKKIIWACDYVEPENSTNNKIEHLKKYNIKKRKN